MVEVAEQQVVDLLCGVKLPSDWQEWAEQPLHAAGAGDAGGIRAGAAGAAGSGDRVASGRGDQQGEVPGREVAVSGEQGRFASSGVGCYSVPRCFGHY